jgi:uncharacterized damage-inducible protein DinB
VKETTRIADQLRRAFEGEAWHGPAVLAILEGVGAAEAAGRPVPGGHSFWELVLHIATWDDVVRRRLEGERAASLSAEQDWLRAEAGEDAWEAAKRRLVQNHERLRLAIEAFDDRRLDETVPGAEYSFYVMLHGVVQHDLYHAGQMALLKKAARA